MPPVAAPAGAPPAHAVHRVITDLGVLDVTDDGLLLVETAPGVTAEEVAARTGAEVRTAAGTPT